jgi:hypothetical protein
MKIKVEIQNKFYLWIKVKLKRKRNLVKEPKNTSKEWELKSK